MFSVCLFRSVIKIKTKLLGQQKMQDSIVRQIDFVCVCCKMLLLFCLFYLFCPLYFLYLFFCASFCPFASLVPPCPSFCLFRPFASFASCTPFCLFFCTFPFFLYGSRSGPNAGPNARPNEIIFAETNSTHHQQSPALVVIAHRLSKRHKQAKQVSKYK